MRRFILSLACSIVCLCLIRQVPANTAEQARWWLKTQRMLQTNLREIDATMDLDKYVNDVKDYKADVVLFNVGGIVANYPTQLQYHYRNPNMKGDLVGTVLKRLHKEGIRVIGRFDFSKINEKFAAQKPEWLYVSEKGKNVNYNGQVHTCVSGGYQQEYMFKILGEAVDSYPLDGVFFNMIGYQKSDYSGNYHGICQCKACKEKFHKFSGMELPPKRDDSNPAYKKYLDFTRSMSDKQFHRVNNFLKVKKPKLTICTYTTAGVDVIRKESNSALGRGTYYDTEKAKRTLLESGRRQLANAAVHFIAIPYRHASVSPYLTIRRLWQQMVNGAWMDFYCIGPLQRQEDRLNLDLLRRLYRFHAANERWLTSTNPAGEVGLVRRGDQEYDGLFQILSENHVSFDLTTLDYDRLKRHSLVIVPDAGKLNLSQCSALDKYVSNGGKLFLTGKLPAGLKCIGSIEYTNTRPTERGAYIRIRPEDRARLDQPDLEKFDLVFLRSPFHVYNPKTQAEGLLRLIPSDMYGPPEKCYYRNVSDYPALFYKQSGRGSAAFFPWDIGAHYKQQSHVGHASLVMGTIDNLLELDRRLVVEASPLVEVTHRAGQNGKFEWISLFNHSGQRGIALHQPVPISGIHIDLKSQKSVKSVRLLKAGRELDFKKSPDNRVHVIVPQLDHYEIVLFEYQS